MMSLARAGLLGVLNGVQGSSNVAVFGLEEVGQPPSFIAEPHRQHRGQRLHQTWVSFWRGRGRSLMTAEVFITASQRTDLCTHLEAGVDKEPPPAGLWAPAKRALAMGSPALLAAATAAHL